MDLDYTCLKPLDELAYRYRFFSLINPPLPFSKLPVTSLSIIGSSNNHPMLNKLREYLTDYY
jgi:hypothetical protein